MKSDSSQKNFDLLLIGSGLAATACARALALMGRRVGFMPGAGRSRRLDADGGLVDAQLVDQAFGPGAPIGQVVQYCQRFLAADLDAGPQIGPLEEMLSRRTYQRLDLEAWCRERAIGAGAEYLDGFVEGQVVQLPDGALALSSESGDQTLLANTIALCEGYDPRIGTGAGLRPDYGPEEQLQFAKAMITRSVEGDVYRFGSTRTSWGMPIQVEVIPFESAVMVSVVARIENMMRCSRSSIDALDDLLDSRLAEALGLRGEPLHRAVELVYLRHDARRPRLSQDRLLVSIDACGLPDPRELRRADVTIRAGLHMANFVTGTGERSWDEFARPVVEVVRATNPRWKESRSTGFLEERVPPVGIRRSMLRAGSGMLRELRMLRHNEHGPA